MNAKRTLFALALCMTTQLHHRASAQGLRPPPDAKKTAPVVDLKSGLMQTSAVVEGTVSDITYEYDDTSGPVTVVTLADVTTHLGKGENVMKIRQVGGPRPDNRFLFVSDMVRFQPDQRYIVFLRNTSWNLSPVVHTWAFLLNTTAANMFDSSVDCASFGNPDHFDQLHRRCSKLDREPACEIFGVRIEV